MIADMKEQVVAGSLPLVVHFSTLRGYLSILF